MKSGWERYASEKRYVQKGYLRKHCDGSSGRKTREASRRDCVQQCRKSQKEEVELSGNSGQVDDPLMEYGRHVILTEEVVYIGDENEERRQEESAEALKRRQKGIQGADQRRSKANEIPVLKQKERKVRKAKN